VSNPDVDSIPLGWDAFLQRLFSTFPNSWPGFGLLLFRLGIGIALIYLGVSRLFGALGAPITAARDLIEAAGGIFLLAGLWTPIMGALIAIDELWIAFSLNSSQPDSRLIHIFLAVLTAGVAMLGPGAWSIDARLFGRKRFKMRDRNRGRKPSL
jgi:putative oxidoreductase